jgi:hypothetical protein
VSRVLFCTIWKQRAAIAEFGAAAFLLRAASGRITDDGASEIGVSEDEHNPHEQAARQGRIGEEAG